MNVIVKYFKNLPVKEATKFLVIYYIVGVVGFLIPALQPVFEKLIPLSFAINIFLLLLFHKPLNNKHVWFFVAVVIFTFLVEAIGVKTGVLFGDYIYGKSIPIKLFDTPILIGVNWLVLTYGAVAIIRHFKALRRFLPVLVGVLMTVFDFVMEPVAMKTAMWGWAYNTIPAQNYFMWFIIAVIIASFFELLKIETKNKVAIAIFCCQLVFFFILNLFL